MTQNRKLLENSRYNDADYMNDLANRGLPVQPNFSLRAPTNPVWRMRMNVVTALLSVRTTDSPGFKTVVMRPSKTMSTRRSTVEEIFRVLGERESTSGRMERLLGATGVSTTAGVAGWIIGPPAARL